MTAIEELPMFPLGTVLFPHTAIPLHVFEPRYRALTGWCLEHDKRLGVVLIERGSEVGGGDVRFSVGTEGRIVDASPLADGHWLLLVVGERRLRVRQWLPEEPFPRAEVEFLEDGPSSADLSGVRDALVRKVHRAVGLRVQLGEWPFDQPAPELAPDPSLVVWQAAGLGLIGPVDAQRLLETDPLDRRLWLLSSLLDEEIDVLALRAAEG
jgi:Lon protease-like protein